VSASRFIKVVISPVVARSFAALSSVLALKRIWVLECERYGSKAIVLKIM
jgi:hypothetical protein